MLELDNEVFALPEDTIACKVSVDWWIFAIVAVFLVLEVLSLFKKQADS